MSKKRCDNYDICKKYNIYGACEYDDNSFISPASCGVFEKQAITILSSIDEKLSQLLGAKADT